MSSFWDAIGHDVRTAFYAGVATGIAISLAIVIIWLMIIL